MPLSLWEIQSTLPNRNPALVPALEPILMVTIPGVVDTFMTVIDKMTPGTNFTLANLFHAENANLTQKDLKTSIDGPENRMNIHLVSYNTCTARAKHQATANSPTVDGVIGFLMSPIRT